MCQTGTKGRIQRGIERGGPAGGSLGSPHLCGAPRAHRQLDEQGWVLALPIGALDVPVPQATGFHRLQSDVAGAETGAHLLFASAPT